jgi:hypothetical protein
MSTTAIVVITGIVLLAFVGICFVIYTIFTGIVKEREEMIRKIDEMLNGGRKS